MRANLQQTLRPLVVGAMDRGAEIHNTTRRGSGTALGKRAHATVVAAALAGVNKQVIVVRGAGRSQAMIPLLRMESGVVALPFLRLCRKHAPRAAASTTLACSLA